jgi:hypothetical protein
MWAKEIARVLRDVHGHESVRKNDVNRILDSHQGFERGESGSWTFAGGPDLLDTSASVPIGPSGDLSQLWEEVIRNVPRWESKLAYLPSPERKVLLRRQPLEALRGGRRGQLALTEVARALTIVPGGPLHLSEVKRLEAIGLTRLLSLGAQSTSQNETSSRQS